MRSILHHGPAPRSPSARAVVLLVAAALAAAGFAPAQNFEMEQSVIAPGGDTATGDDWTLDATLGQPAAGVAQGDAFVLFAGFWVPDNVEAPPTEVVFSDGFEEAP